MVQTYRKKTSEVRAIQYTGENHGELVDWGTSGYFDAEGHLWLWVLKSSANCHVAVGDFIIQEQDGKGFYPCAEQVMHQTYDLVNGVHSG